MGRQKTQKGGKSLLNKVKNKLSGSKKRHHKQSKTKTRGRKISSTVGDILSHIDVRSKKDIPEFIKRITKGPVTVVLVYADWCGHCHTYKPEFNKLAQSPNRTSQVLSLNETMVDAANESLKKLNNNAKSIKVDGYPSTLVVSNNGSLVENVERRSIGEVMNQSGTLAKQSIAAPSVIESPLAEVKEPSFTEEYKEDNIIPEYPSLSPSKPSSLSSSSSTLPNTPPVPTFTAPMKPAVAAYKPKQDINISGHVGGSLYRKMAESMKAVPNPFSLDIMKSFGKKHTKKHRK